MRTSLGRRRETTDVSILLNLKEGARKLTQGATGAPSTWETKARDN